tara:strand:- start:113 stop:1219 length:1107 start_codon:yes stop_codon:yes gene_type:complete
MFRRLLSNFSNSIGWSTKEKLIIIESDDWGSHRIQTRESFQRMLNNGFSISNDPYCQFDALETNYDLDRLFNVLLKHKDSRGNSPVITALCIMANPDFNKIKDSNFNNYYYKPISEEIKDDSLRSSIVDIWKKGNEENLFKPQFHGREHLNVTRWMNDLKSNNQHTLMAFDEKCWGIYSEKINYEYQAAFNIGHPTELRYLKSVINDGIRLFKKQLGFSPEFFVPTNGPFNTELEGQLYENGIKYILLNKFQKEPLGNNRYKYRFRYLGKQSNSGLIYTTRNCAFEPSQKVTSDPVGLCLSQVEKMFKLNKPAVISSHRLNFIGYHDQNNADQNLMYLDLLLHKIIQKWPDVQFITTSELGELITREC